MSAMVINVRNDEMCFSLKPGVSIEPSCFSHSGKMDLADRWGQGSQRGAVSFSCPCTAGSCWISFLCPRTGAGAAFSPRQGRVASWDTRTWQGLNNPMWWRVGASMSNSMCPTANISISGQFCGLYSEEFWIYRQVLDLQISSEVRGLCISRAAREQTDKQVLFLQAELS